MQKDSGEFPIIGVNTYLSDKKEEWKPIELSRASSDEKNDQIKRLETFKATHQNDSEKILKRLRDVALAGGNIFEELLTTVRYCSLGQITSVLYEVGGRYRRNM
jgi:methylmalonyl-CoA mutase